MEKDLRKKLMDLTKNAYPPAAAHAAGDRGEQEVISLVQDLAKSGDHSLLVFPATRVPKPHQNSKYEIDLVLAGPFGILALEVKSWGGTLDIAPKGQWRQTTRGGAVLYHADPALLLHQKAEALHDYLHQNKVPLPKSAMHAAIVWTNPISLEGSLGQKSTSWLLEETAARVESALLKPGTKSPTPVIADLSAVDAALARLPTWDVVYLRGGDLAKGDIAVGEIITEAGPVTREDAYAMGISYPRSRLAWLFSSPKATWRTYGNVYKKAKLMADQSVTVTLAGRGQKVTYHLAEVLGLSFGWRNNSYYRPVAPDFSTYAIGATYMAKVKQIHSYGVFVGLDDYRDALLPTAALTEAERRRLTIDASLPVKIVRKRIDERGKLLIDVALTKI